MSDTTDKAAVSIPMPVQIGAKRDRLALQIALRAFVQSVAQARAGVQHYAEVHIDQRDPANDEGIDTRRDATFLTIEAYFNDLEAKARTFLDRLYKAAPAMTPEPFN